MLLSATATCLATSSAFVTPVTQIVTSPPRSLHMSSTEVDVVVEKASMPAPPLPAKRMSDLEYIVTLPGTPFPDGKIFDPLGLCDGADPGEIKRWREAEIKHGRVSMLATVGVVVAEVGC